MKNKNSITKNSKVRITKALTFFCLLTVLATAFSVCSYAASIDTVLSGMLDSEIKPQIMGVINHFVMPLVAAVILVILIIQIVKSYKSYKEHQEMQWELPIVLLVCLVICLSSPLWMWQMIGWA